MAVSTGGRSGCGHCAKAVRHPGAEEAAASKDTRVGTEV